MAGEWKEMTVAELQAVEALLVEDGNHGENRPRPDEFSTEGIQFIRAADMDCGRVLFESAQRINEVARVRVRKGIGAGGDVLLSHKGTVGKVAYVPLDAPPFVCSPQTTFWRVTDPKRLDRRYIYFYLLSRTFREQLDSRKGETDMADYVSLTTQRTLKVVVPPLAEQKAIAAVLGAFDDKIELNRRMNATLESMARALFQSWFVDFDPVRAKLDGRQPAGLDADTAALFPNSFQDSALGQIPNGWSIKGLDELMEIQGGTQPPASEFLSEHAEGYVRLVQIRDYESDAHLTFVRDTPKLRKCRRDDVMIARYGASVARICWGLDGAYNVALVKAAPIKMCYREFIRSYLQTHDFQARLIGMSNRSVQAGFNKGDIASFQIATPSENLLEKHEAAAWEMRRRILHNRDQSCTLATLRDTLLPKLLSGELSVGGAESLMESA